MNIQIISDEKRQLLNRREVTAKLGYEHRTPSRVDIKKEIAKKLNVKEDLVVVKMVNPDYGTTSAFLEIDVYDDEKTMKDIASDYLAKRGVPKDKKEAQVEEEKKQASPALKGQQKEDKKDDKKAEEPKEGKKQDNKEEAPKPKEEKKEENPKENK